jgi:hypothetical protein
LPVDPAVTTVKPVANAISKINVVGGGIPVELKRPPEAVPNCIVAIFVPLPAVLS